MTTVSRPAQPLLSPPARSRRGEICGWIGLAVLLVLFAILLRTYFAPAISEPDDNGYFAQGSLLAQTGSTQFKQQSDAQYIGMHWLIAPSQNFVSRYPPGLPVAIAALYATLGYKASVCVNPALALLALAGFYLLARRVAAWHWALVGTAVLGANPTFFHHALGCGSHMGVLFCIVWGLYWLLRWSESGRIWQVFVAGIIFGCIPSIRYADAVVGLGVVVFLAWHMFRWPRIWWHYLAAVGGALIPIVPLLIHTHFQTGSFWKTAYSLTHEQEGFRWEYFQAHAINYIQQVQGNGVGMLFALGVIGMVTMMCLRPWRKLGVMAALFTVPMLLVYMAYYWAPQFNAQMTMRFVLPTFPVYVLAGVWALAELTRHSRRAAQIAVPLTLLAVQVLWAGADVLDEGQRMEYQREVLAKVTDALDAVAPPESVVLADNEMMQHLDFVRKWKVANEMLIQRRGLMGGPGGPGGRFGPAGGDANAPSPGQAEKQQLLRDLYPGTTREQTNKFVADVQNWADGQKVYIVGPESSLDQAMGGRGKVTIVSRVKLPEAPAARRTEGLPGAVRMLRFGGPGGGGPPGGPGGPGGMGGPPGGMPGGLGGLMGRLGGGGMMGRGMYGTEVVIAEWQPTGT